MEWEHSQNSPELTAQIAARPDDIPRVCKVANCTTLAFAFTESLTSWEWMRDALAEARRAGLRTVLETNGYVCDKPLKALLPHLSAVKIDLKGWDETFHRSFCGGSLQPVLDNLLRVRESGVWLEIAWPVVPAGNDGESGVVEAANWIRDRLGPEIPLHFLRHYPHYRLASVPETPRRTLTLLRRLAMREGLKHVYIHGVQDHEGRQTFCPNCELPLIARGAGGAQSLIQDGRCPFCRVSVAGVWGAPTLTTDQGVPESVV